MGDLGPMGVMPRSRKFRVAAIFYSGMYEYDATHAYVLASREQFFDPRTPITQIDIRSNPGATARPPSAATALAGRRRADAAARPRRTPGPRLDGDEQEPSSARSSWRRSPPFIILSIASRSRASASSARCSLMVTEKGKEIAILKALGASTPAS